MIRADFVAITEVEGILFRVPRHPIEKESEVFKDMFALPVVSNHGSSDETPIALHGVAVIHFRAFLRVLFDPFVKHTRLELFRY